MAVPLNDFKTTMTTMFWVGEQADAENAYIPNHESYWDKDWLASFGGVDDPWHRNGHWPAGFAPKENPFYVALPYGEFAEQNQLKAEASDIPWYRPGLDPLLKNRWVEIRYNGRSCYAQWQDVGPCGEDDFGFVFGDADVPLNTFDAEAGLDLSPAVWHHLGMTDNALPRFHKFAPNVVGFSGYNGRGIAPGTVFGRTLAEHILGRIGEADLPLPLTALSEPSFRALKEIWYEAGAQVAHFADARF